MNPTPARTPLVSICIPVYNTERFVADAVQSALSQSFRDLELVIFDNASTDATPRILDGFRDPRIRRFRNERNVGPVANFNRALAEARGRYVKMLCADDVLYPHCLERQAEALERDPEHALAMVSCSRDIIDERGRRWLRRRYPGRAGRIGGRAAVAATARRGANVIGEPTAIMARTEALRQVGGFDARYGFCVDLDLWSRLLALGDLQVLAETLCAFRISSQSWSVSLRRRQRSEFVQFVDDLQASGRADLSVLDRRLGRLRIAGNTLLRDILTRLILLRGRREPAKDGMESGSLPPASAGGGS